MAQGVGFRLVSNLGAKTVLLTMLGFVAIYTVLLIIEMKLMLAAIRKGPDARELQALPGDLPLPAHLTANPSFTPRAAGESA